VKEKEEDYICKVFIFYYSVTIEIIFVLLANITVALHYIDICQYIMRINGKVNTACIDSIEFK